MADARCVIMKPILQSLAALLAIALLPMDAQAQSVSSMAIRPLGRVAELGPTSLSIEWPMSGFEATFEGGELSAEIEDTRKNWLNVEVDGTSHAVALKEGSQTYTLFSGPAGPHIIRVTRRTGAQEGPTTFVSVSADALHSTQRSDRRILVIGDSIASGYGVEGKNQTCQSSQATQNAGLAWPALLSRTFGADLDLISVDGGGLYRNYEGEAPTMASVMWRTLPSEEAIWPGDFRPQLVVVHLGTSDFGDGDPGPRFKDTYVETLGRIRVAYPSTNIIASIGGMLEKPKLAAAKAAIEGAVAVRRGAGDLRTSFVLLDPPARGRRFGCDWHPGVDAQKSMALELELAVTAALGWAPVPTK